MAYTKVCAFFFLMTAFLRASMAAIYEVGDASGWTNRGTNYKSWASKHKFRLSDVIVFKYNPKIHNVLQVTKEDYQACSCTAPLAAYTSGDDPIELRSPGKYYFICSFPGMCQDGQKLEIKVSSSTNRQPTTVVYSASSAASYSPLALLIFASCVSSLNLH